MLVDQILNSKPEGGVVTIAPDASVADAAALLSELRIGAVVVSEDGKAVIGILSERDIVRELGKRGSGCLNDSVSSLMTTKLVTCERGDSALQVLEKMSDGRFRHMPVIDDGTMVGLISIGDAVQARLNELKMERDALEGMVMGH